MPGMWVELHCRRLINETPEACWLLSIEALGCTIMSRLNQVVFSVFSNTREIPGFTASYPVLPLSHPLLLFPCFKSWQRIIFLLSLFLPFNFGGIRVKIFGLKLWNNQKSKSLVPPPEIEPVTFCLWDGSDSDKLIALQGEL